MWLSYGIDFLATSSSCRLNKFADDERVVADDERVVADDERVVAALSNRRMHKLPSNGIYLRTFESQLDFNVTGFATNPEIHLITVV